MRHPAIQIFIQSGAGLHPLPSGREGLREGYFEANNKGLKNN
jgi:hypothetical protein